MEKNGGQVRRIRDSNQKRILSLMLERRELSKSQIAVETLLSVPTVTMNVSRLMEMGLVEEAGVSASQGGRKPMMMRFLPDSRLAFGVDFSSNHLTSSGLIRVILVNLDAKVRAEESFEYADFSSVGQIMSHVKKVTERMLASEGVPAERVMGIGFSLPGPVNEKNYKEDDLRAAIDMLLKEKAAGKAK